MMTAGSWLVPRLACVLAFATTPAFTSKAASADRGPRTAAAGLRVAVAGDGCPKDVCGKLLPALTRVGLGASLVTDVELWADVNMMN